MVMEGGAEGGAQALDGHVKGKCLHLRRDVRGLRLLLPLQPHRLTRRQPLLPAQHSTVRAAR